MEPVDNYASDSIEIPLDEGHAEDSMSVRDSGGEVRWVGIARNAYETSTSYFDSNIRTQVEKNLKMFRSQHPPSSKYNMPAYKFRSKIFRPKTRTVIRRHEASASLAFFSTQDTVSCRAENQDDPSDRMGAEFAKNLIQYRLEHSIPWFQTVIGGYQDAMTQGVVISRQEWVYTTKEIEVDVPDIGILGLQEVDEDGEPKTKSQKATVIDEDHPDIVLVPVENFRFDPACDWRDPAGTSPYLIEMMPMYVHQIKTRMEEDNPKTGEKKWRELGDGVLRAATQTGDYDSTRSVREGQREDSKDVQHEVGLFDIVWVHRNIVTVEGQDWIYYTLGTEHLLSDPVPVEDIYLHGRPYAVGCSVLETHKTYPSGTVELGQTLQHETNDVANQRLDNIKLALNRRYMAKRGTNVDWRALTTSTPGGVVLMDDLNHVKEERMSDVTQSSYEEQNRINVDYDDLMGNFSQSTVQTNNALNKTLGGQNLAADDTNVVTEYQLRVFTETWVERVLKHLHAMEVHYETDDRVLEIAGSQAMATLGKKSQPMPISEDMPKPGEAPAPDAQLPQEPPPQPTPEADVPVDAASVAKLIARPMSVRVGVGFGATAPHKRVEKLDIGLSTVAKFAPQKLRNVNFEEVSKEIFGALGFRDGSRFFNDEDDVDPQVQELQQQLQEMQKIIETKQVDQQTKLQIAKMNNQAKMQVAQMGHDHQQRMKSIEAEIKFIEKRLAAETNDIKRGQLVLQKQALEWQQKTEEINMLTAERDKIHKNMVNNDERQYQRRGVPEPDGQMGDGLPDDRPSTVVQNNNYGQVPFAED